MKLVTKFDLDQRVWAISNSNYGDPIPDCSICNRAGVVTLKGEQLTCPKCGGRSVPPKWTIQVSGGVVVKVEAVRTVIEFKIIPLTKGAAEVSNDA